MDTGTGGFFKRVGTQAAREDVGARAQRVNDGCAPSAAPEPQSMLVGEGARRWAARGDTFWGAAETYDAIPAGLYACGINNNVGPVLIRLTLSTDNLLVLPDPASSTILSEFQSFWTMGDKFRERGFLHKRGFLLWGPPGSGKTSCLQLLVKELIETCNGIVLFVDHPDLAMSCLRMVRTIEPTRPIVAVMEDFDALIRTHGEGTYLAMLDGEAQVDNIVFLATTNYPERLDRRFVDRPSRFDTVRYIGMPSAEARRVYLKAKDPTVSDDELDAWVVAMQGYSVAYLKELIISIRCFGKTLAEVEKLFEEMHERHPTSDDTPDKSSVVGFVPKQRGGLNVL
jgi:hypothetical protein